jgi:hypothetical protein
MEAACFSVARRGAPQNKRPLHGVGKKSRQVGLKDGNGGLHLRQIIPAVVDRFHVCLHCSSVVYEPFGNLARRPDLPVDTAIGAAQIVQPPLEHPVGELFLELAPP